MFDRGCISERCTVSDRLNLSAVSGTALRADRSSRDDRSSPEG